MSGSGMIAARPEGLAVDVEAEPEACVSGWDEVKSPASPRLPTLVRAAFFDVLMATSVGVVRRDAALGIIMLAAAKCTEVQALADRGAIDGEGADLFIRRYSESICDIASALAPEAMRESMQTKGN